MKNATSTYIFQILAWVIGFNLLGIPLYFFLYDLQAHLDPTLHFNFWAGVFTNFICGIITGLLLGTVDVLLERFVRKKLSFKNWFLLKSGLYLTVFLILVIITGIAIRFFTTQNLERSVDSTASSSGVNIMLGYLIFIAVYSTLVSFVGQMRKMFGKGVLLPLFFGYYFKPKTEERIFMFLDLKSSTTIAEKLGHIKFSRFIQDCFYDLDKAIVKYQANLYQYVGDEAILTWQTKEGISDNNCIRVYFYFLEILKNKNRYYLKNYGVAPEFKAGLHIGDATVAEVGNQKKELAYHGDVLNTTARIQSICNDYKKRFLISEKLISQLNLNDEFKIGELGELPLKGKSELVKIFSIEKIK